MFKLPDFSFSLQEIHFEVTMAPKRVFAVAPKAKESPDASSSSNRSSNVPSPNKSALHSKKKKIQPPPAPRNALQDQQKGRVPWSETVFAEFGDISEESLGRRVKEAHRFVTLGEKFCLKLCERSIVGIDDTVYSKSRTIWEGLPRGQCKVFLKECNNDSDYTEVCLMHGIRKFGYSDASYGYPKETVKAVALIKENGECAHVASFRWQSNSSEAAVKFWVVGSKNVTLVYRDGFAAEDGKMYEGQRYSFALKIMHLWEERKSRMSVADQNTFFDLLADGKYTASGEAIFADSQHLVDYFGKNDLIFFGLAMTSADSMSSASGLCIPPGQALDLFKSCGLTHVNASNALEFGSDEYKAYINEIARRENSEGCVMYGLNGDGKVCCMWKEKSYPYVMERYARECIVNGYAGPLLESRLKIRLTKEPAELRAHFTGWEQHRLPFLLKFAAWLRCTGRLAARGSNNAKDDNDRHDETWSVKNKWITLQTECQQIDEETLLSMVEALGKAENIEQHFVMVMMCGPPGAGKSTLARALCAMLSAAGQTPRWHNQDEAGSRNQYLMTIKQSIANHSVTHVILDKSNLAEANRNDYVELNLMPTLTLVFNHPEGSEALIDCCVERVRTRGVAHRSLTGEVIDLPNIISSFVNNMSLPIDDTVVALDVRDTPEVMLQTAWGKLVEFSAVEGRTPLPPFSEADGPARIQKIISEAAAYEQKLAVHSTLGRPQSFACLAFKGDSETILRLLPPESMKCANGGEKNVRPSFHITTKYFGGIMDPSWYVRHCERLGQKLQVQCVALVWDESAVAIQVSPHNFEVENKIPHITVALSPGVPPRYSNQLLQKTEGEGDVHRLPLEDTHLQCTFEFQ